MGFLRVKTVKRHQYVYWCNRARSRKKYGGTGKVKSPDFLLGNSIVDGKYLSFYLYVEDVPLREYAEAAITYIFEVNWELTLGDGTKVKTTDVAAVEIDWRATPKVCLRSRDKRIDLRYQYAHQIKQQLQEYLDVILKLSKSIQDDIDLAAFYFAGYQKYSNLAQANRDELKEYHKNPTKEWTEWELLKDSGTGQWEQREVTSTWKENADIILDEEITDSDRTASSFWDEYYQRLKQLTDYAPRRRQDEFKRAALSQIEKLAKDEQWFEHYKEQAQSDP